MRYRRFGRSDLEVSEVGFGVWTLASDWWGVVEDKQGLLRAALDAGINFIDTAPVYGEDGVGESLLADLLATNRDDFVITTKCGYDIAAVSGFPTGVVTLTVVALIAACVVLPAPIVLGYGLRAAEREDRDAAIRRAGGEPPAARH